MKIGTTKEVNFIAYITKYALTKGVLKKKVSWSSDFPHMVGDIKSRGYYYRGEGDEWHRTYESAMKRAKEMQEKRVASLEKQLKKIRNLSFELKENKKGK